MQVTGNGSCGESGKKNSANVASGADGKYPAQLVPQSLTGVTGNGNVTELRALVIFSDSLVRTLISPLSAETSGPYPMNAPDVAVDKSGFWCVVDGTDVGTSADRYGPFLLPLFQYPDRKVQRSC